MKAILEFDLPDDHYEHKVAIEGIKYMCVLTELDEWFRSKLKYDSTLDEKQYEVYEKSREQLRDIMYNNGVTFND
jgi:hypothetical protein